jgi:hypothetical protein
MALGGYKSTENQPFRHRNDENNEGQNENYSRRQFFSGLLGLLASVEGPRSNVASAPH